MPDAGVVWGLLPMLNPRLDEIVCVTRSLPVRCQVRSDGHTVNVRGDWAGLSKACEYLVGHQAKVLAGESTSEADLWSVCVVASNALATRCSELALELGLEGGTHDAWSFLANYWRPDYAVEPVYRSDEVTVSRHTHPFVGLTVFFPFHRLLLYVPLRSSRCMRRNWSI